MNTKINNNLNITEGSFGYPSLQYSSPSVVSEKDEYKMKLKNNEVKKVKNWNDSCLNIYTRNNDSVTIETIYRYAPSITKKMSYVNFKKWQLEIENSRG